MSEDNEVTLIDRTGAKHGSRFPALSLLSP